MNTPTPREVLLELHALSWLASQPGGAMNTEWSGAGGLTQDEAKAVLGRLVRSGLVGQESSLAGDPGYYLANLGKARVQEISRPAAVKRVRAAFLRDTWIELLYDKRHVSSYTRYRSSHARTEPAFALADPTDQDHSETLRYLI